MSSFYLMLNSMYVSEVIQSGLFLSIPLLQNFWYNIIFTSGIALNDNTYNLYSANLKSILSESLMFGHR